MTMDKKELIELIIDAVQDATDTETGITSIPVLEAFLEEIIPE